MNQFFIANKSVDSVTLSKNQNYYSIHINTIRKSDLSPMAFADIEIGDIIIQTQDFFTLAEPKLYNITQTYYYIKDLSDFHWFNLKFSKIRPIHKGERNKSIALALKVIEYSYLHKDPSILLELKKYLCQNSLNLIDYFVSNLDTHNFCEKMNVLNDYMLQIDCFGKEIFRVFGSFENLAVVFNIKFKFISFPGFLISEINSGGSAEFIFLDSENNFDILYTKTEIFLMEKVSDSKIIKAYSKTKNYKHDAVEMIRQKHSSTIDQTNLIISMIYNDIIRLIDENNIDQTVHKGIDYLASLGYDTSSITNKILEALCPSCQVLTKTLINIDCGHKFCLNCLCTILGHATSQLYVLNEIEKLNHSNPCCLYSNCNQPISNETIKSFLPNYQEYEKQALERSFFVCSCGTQGNLNNFSLKCRHICNNCLFEGLRNSIQACSVCEYYPEETELKYYFSHMTTCDKCLNKQNTIKCFSQKLAKHNLCINCLELCKNWTYVIENQIYSLEKRLELELILKKTCKFCQKQYSRTDLIEKLKNCVCSVCDSCCLQSKKNCPECSLKFPEIITSELVTRDNLKRRKKICPICELAYDVSNLISFINCQHEVCKICFSCNIEKKTSDDIFSIKICPCCDKKIPKYQLQFIVPKNVWDKLSFDFAIKEYKMIKCPKCFYQFIPCDDRKVTCLNKFCNFCFCKDCFEDFHTTGNCKEVLITNMINVVECLNDPDGITQCPKCRIPYTKNQGCDHVKCICGAEFCFNCACLRSPTLAHGSHYHRVGCSWYFKYDGQGDKYSPKDCDSCVLKKIKCIHKCEECIRLGRLCDKPKTLRIPRRVDFDEA